MTLHNHFFLLSLGPNHHLTPIAAWPSKKMQLLSFLSASCCLCWPASSWYHWWLARSLLRGNWNSKVLADARRLSTMIFVEPFSNILAPWWYLSNWRHTLRPKAKDSNFASLTTTPKVAVKTPRSISKFPLFFFAIARPWGQPALLALKFIIF